MYAEAMEKWVAVFTIIILQALLFRRRITETRMQQTSSESLRNQGFRGEEAHTFFFNIDSLPHPRNSHWGPHLLGKNAKKGPT